MTSIETSTAIELSAQETQILLIALDKLPAQGLETMANIMMLATKLRAHAESLPADKGSPNGKGG